MLSYLLSVSRPVSEGLLIVLDSIVLLLSFSRSWTNPGHDCRDITVLHNVGWISRESPRKPDCIVLQSVDGKTWECWIKMVHFISSPSILTLYWPIYAHFLTMIPAMINDVYWHICDWLISLIISANNYISQNLKYMPLNEVNGAEFLFVFMRLWIVPLVYRFILLCVI